jgi:phospholipid/cholesterol/gamma-HCH transport system ATP-binding protein
MVMGKPGIAAATAPPPPAQRVEAAPPAVVFDRVSFAFDDQVVLRDLSFTIPAGRMTILLGASGTGKSIALKLVMGLLRPDSGTITVAGHRIERLPEAELMAVRADIGMLFQENALFDSLTVAENVGYRLFEETDMPTPEIRQRVEEVLGFVGLSAHIDKMPSALSGGERRRVAIARAMAARPRLLLFDDPTSGLDPITATSIDVELIKLRDFEQVTSMVVTHQIRDAFYLATHRAAGTPADPRIEAIGAEEPERADFMVLQDGRISFTGSGRELLDSPDPFLRHFLFKTLPPW